MPIRQYLNFLGTQTPWYGICAGVGLLAIGIWMLTGFTRFRMNGRQQNEILFAFPFMIIGGVLFAFMLDALFTGNWRTWNDSTTRKFGFTYTGWLTGCLLFICIYGRFTTFGSRFLLNFFFTRFCFITGDRTCRMFFGWLLLWHPMQIRSCISAW